MAGHSTGGMAMLSTGNTIMKPMSEAEFEFYVHAQKNVPEGFWSAIGLLSLF